MSKNNLALLSIVAAVLISTVTEASQFLYLASTQDKSIVAYRVNDDTGELTKTSSVDLPGNAGPMAFSPDKSFVYAAVTGLKDGKAGVSTLKRSSGGTLKLLKTANITDRAPYIRTDNDGRYLLAAHYGVGEVTVYRIVDGICSDSHRQDAPRAATQSQVRAIHAIAGRRRLDLAAELRGRFAVDRTEDLSITQASELIDAFNARSDSNGGQR